MGLWRATGSRKNFGVKLTLIAALAATAGSCLAEDVAAPGGTIDLQLTRPLPTALHGMTTAWIENSARAVANYYGTFPVRHVVLRITPRAGRGPEDGQTSGWSGNLIQLALGRATNQDDLADDWVLVHEMLHLGFPDVDDSHHWLEEGLATYIEPIARARVGLLTPARVWGDMVEGLPQGQPEKGDRGLDVTHTWGRTYWGGALFCLRADVEIRRRTGNRRGLEHALRAIVAAGGTVGSEWKIERVIATGDRATGVPVLRELYDAMKTTPVTVDLAALWKQLGVVRRGRTVTFDDTAPLAAVRKAITGG